MRSIILATALALAPAIALAQGTFNPGTGAPSNPGTVHPDTTQPIVEGNDSAPTHSAMNTQPDPNNCGTPDEPKACPPLPRHALKTYPPNR